MPKKTVRKSDNWINTYLEYTEEHEPPDIWKKWTAISTVAAALQRKCIYKVGHLETFPNLYTILVGPAAVGKGVAMQPGRDLLAKNGIRVGTTSMTRVGLIQELIDTKAKTPLILDGKPYFHSSLSIFSPEFEVFVSQGDPQFRGVITDMFDCGMSSAGVWSHKTGMRGTEAIDNIWLNILGGTTPDILQSLSAAEIVHGGLSSRIIFVYALSKSKSIPFPEVHAKQKKLYTILEDDLMAIHLMSGVFSLTEEFRESFGEWYIHNDKPKNYPFIDSRLTPYCGRRGLHLRKLCMIVSASRSSDMVITKGDFDIALSYLLEVEQDMLRVFGGMGHLGVEGLILHKVETHIEEYGEVPLDQLLELYRHDITYDGLIRVLKVLQKTGKVKYVREVSTKGGVQKTEREIVRWIKQ